MYCWATGSETIVLLLEHIKWSHGSIIIGHGSIIMVKWSLVVVNKSGAMALLCNTKLDIPCDTKWSHGYTVLDTKWSPVCGCTNNRVRESTS